jgi:hypothetical protein
VLLGLRLGRHVDGLVDAYFGPEELAAQVEAEQLTPVQELAEEADALVEMTGDGWLRDQLAALRAYAGVLAGEAISYAYEVERCYGVRPVRAAEEVYAEAHEQLDRLLPGDGSLAERRLAWKQRHVVPVERLVSALRDVVSDLRTRAGEVFGLPEGEGLTIDEVRNEPWWAFNYYGGNLTSRVVVNVDVPTSGPDLVHLAAHEAYPGHHLEHVWKEQLLVRGRDLLEETIFLVPTGQALVSEGIAETGADLLLDAAGRAEVQELLEAHGAGYDAEAAHELGVALEALRTAGLDAALMIHEEGRPIAEAQAYVERWGLRTSEQAAHEISFVTDPTWRAYAITYSAGRDLCRRYVSGDPARFRRLLTEQVRVRDLLTSCA